MHLAQALTRLPRKGAWPPRGFTPDGKRTHCKFGYFLILQVGLNLPRSLTSLVDICDPLPQIVHVLGMLAIIVIPALSRNPG